MGKLTTFKRQDVDVIKEETLWQGYFKMLKFSFRHALFGGGRSQTIERELFSRGNAVVVIPYDPVTDQLILIEQIRVGAFEHQISPWMVELVAGIIDEGEQPLDVAIRETKEETGLDVTRCEALFSYLSSPGGTSERIDLFVACVDSSKAADIAGLDSEGEDIRVFAMPVAEVLRALNDGEFFNATTIIGLQWLALNHGSLRQRWLDLNNQESR
ncbi:NUDIX domain-containing protein [Psychrobium sp. 1_MG-2023]|uniref:NUDIX domain-containing protein n=1 Tax=Psychrobium sp. 1_MG-2023 TaxID=3062624 RepID=UPI000C33457E|nr:NUDIX domain-containing protein [Psychrobium sp. 1_MG-2023]MDP2561221.1 NUDIX domain-containing protein [Psychrobium sp. 1_MG-2023]PKF55275.1 ADP-ribose diphosphatase [Alteromonadales bacterium alter-6D02]